jgi:acetoin utilization deacetylase AcuC-like enzyme
MSSTEHPIICKVVVAYDTQHIKHVGPASSAECPERVDTIIAHLRDLRGIEWRVASDAVMKQTWPYEIVRNCSTCTFPLSASLATCTMCGNDKSHDWNYVQDKEGDTTYQTPYSAEIVDRASRMVTREMDMLCDSGTATLTFALTRPPGHHACSSRRVGFCLRNFAIDALDTAAARGKRALILDIDAHHGDGTEKEIHSRSFGHYCSLHAFGLNIYPGTGAESSERCLNIPLLASTGDSEWIAAFSGQAMPWIRTVDPSVIILSCGLDAHDADTLVPLHLTERSFAHCAIQLRSLGIPVLAILEGGYHVPVLGSCIKEIITPFL